jgi:uncharacterized protein YoxC
MDEAEGKIDMLTSRMALINRTEQRLNDLNILAEDINTKIKVLSSEEKVIDKASGQITELRFLLGEVEKKLSDYTKQNEE